MLTVIIAGGVGERFWPWSRRKRPKQLLDLTGRGSMIDLTVSRVSGLSEPEEILILTNIEQKDAILEEVAGRIPEENVVGEPSKQDTAPCIGLAAVLLRAKYGDQPMLVLPADHLIEPAARFRSLASSSARYVAQHACLLTFGIKPTRPETGYGYIHAGEPLSSADGDEIFRAKEFLEKPDADKAREFVEDGNYYWNSGMFMWTTETILREMSAHLPEAYGLLMRIEREIGTRPLSDVLKELYPQIPPISIDYGIMEKASDVVMAKAEFEWNDVGSWEFMRDAHPSDENDNVSIGDHVLIDASGNTIVSPDRPVALLGVDNLVVIDGGDTILVCKRDRVQEVKKVVKVLRGSKNDVLT